LPGSNIFEFLKRQPLLTGDKVRLRPRRPEDAVAEYRWRIDEELCRLDASEPLNQTYDEFLQRYTVELEYPGLTYTRAIDTLDGIHIGSCSLFNLDLAGGAAETGIMIGEKPYWGRGYGKDAMGTLILDIFETSGLQRLMLRTLEWNVRARACFERCGFVQSGGVVRGEHRFIVMQVERGDVPGKGQ
jgi:RimJ/RimL family protein N-acetyltransferase